MRESHLQIEFWYFPRPAYHITGTSGFPGQVVCPIRCFVLVVHFANQTEIKEDDVISDIKTDVLKRNSVRRGCHESDP